MVTIKNNHTVSNEMKPTLSACMIVKNEEKFLPQCLKSIKDVVDEIIIVDTGSTDRTVEIAKSFGAKVYHHPWRNSFSEARNNSLSYATCDWILQIDADEALEQADIPLLHKLMNDNSCNVIFVAIYSELPGGQAKHYFQRIFRRGRAHFEGIVHNQLIFEGKALQSEIRLYHYGYNLSEREMQKKYKRTGDLLRQQLAENPDNIFIMANLIRNYRNEYNFEKVIELGEGELRRSISQTDLVSKNQRQRISIDLAHALINTDQVIRAEEVCKEALKESPDSFDVLLVLGEIVLKKGAFREAIQYFKNYLILKEKENKEPTFYVLSSDFYFYEHSAYNNIGECHKRLGFFNEAEIAYKRALELNHKEPLYYSNLINMYVSQNRLNEAEHLANKAIQLGIADHLTYLLMGKMYVTQGKTKDAINAFKQSVRLDDKSVTANTYLINMLIQANLLKEAEETLKVIISMFPDELKLKCLAERINYKKGDKKGAIHFIRNIVKSNSLDSSAYLEFGDLCMETEEYATAIEVFEKYLTAFPSVDAIVIASLATCYAKLGKRDSAIFGFQTALKMDPNCACAKQNLAVLQN